MMNEQTLHSILKNRFGFSVFRPSQYEAITTLLTHGRLLCIQPTGHGKSLLYQLPTVILPGLTLVISPLLALMRDQLVHLNTRFAISAASLNTDQTDEENFAAMLAAKNKKIKILFIAPEQLSNIKRFNFLVDLPVSLLVIDEAHCISTWGHDFRPSYREIIKFIRAFEQKNTALKILGLTATADNKTESDIKKQLSAFKQKMIIHRSSMNRANIQLSVISTNGIAHKLSILMELLPQLPGNGLVYCSTRENTELVAEYFIQQGISAVAYHAGLSSERKRELQDHFIANQYKIVVATNALGMGIDKSDLRFIIHFNLPGSITAYYQEVGRCGRDGKLAHGILLFDPGDRKIQQHFIDSAQPSLNDFELILDTIRQSSELLNINTIRRLSGLHPTLVTVILAELIEQNYLTKILYQRQQVYEFVKNDTAIDLSRYQNQYQNKIRELKAMINYGEQHARCLMQLLCEHLGDNSIQPCGHCSVCRKSQFILKNNPSRFDSISNWLKNRTITLDPIKTNNIAAGISLLDGKLRPPLFIDFMQQRHKSVTINPELIELIKSHVNILKKNYALKSIIIIPSRTWASRESLSTLLADYLKIPALLESLYWQNQPTTRQGELLNNDQRRHNVDKKMRVKLAHHIPYGAILLLDDYIGSGATLKEAARALRIHGNIKHPIVPFTIASVKWHLGRAGMV